MAKFLYFLGKNQWLEDPQEIKKTLAQKKRVEKTKLKNRIIKIKQDNNTPKYYRYGKLL